MKNRVLHALCVHLLSLYIQSRSRPFNDVKWPVLPFCGWCDHLTTNFQLGVLRSAHYNLIPRLILRSHFASITPWNNWEWLQKFRWRSSCRRRRSCLSSLTSLLGERIYIIESDKTCHYGVTVPRKLWINMKGVRANYTSVSSPNITVNQMNGYKTAQGQKMYLENRQTCSIVSCIQMSREAQIGLAKYTYRPYAKMAVFK